MVSIVKQIPANNKWIYMTRWNKRLWTLRKHQMDV